MSSIDNNTLFEQYYQNEYDFNTTSLSNDEVEDIKRLVKEKRVDYAQAPMGTKIFEWISAQGQDIRFEMVDFASEKIDGMLYIPSTGKDRAYIILNSNKPLINQIFTTAHEYYHYIKDYQKFKNSPYICDFSELKNINEKRASRFAAELLLPEIALHNDVKRVLKVLGFEKMSDADFTACAALAIFLTVQYQIPLKAVIYRLKEEGFIENIDNLIVNYEFLKQFAKHSERQYKQVEELYCSENEYIKSYLMAYTSTQENMKSAFLAGLASKDDILRDADILGFDTEEIAEFINIDEDMNVNEDDDEELFALLSAKRG